MAHLRLDGARVLVLDVDGSCVSRICHVSSSHGGLVSESEASRTLLAILGGYVTWFSSQKSRLD